MAQDKDTQQLLKSAWLWIEQGESNKTLPVLESIQVEDEQQQKERDYLLAWGYIEEKRPDEAFRILSPFSIFPEPGRDEQSLNERERLALSLLALGKMAINFSLYEEAADHLMKAIKVLRERKVHLPLARVRARYSLGTTYCMRGLNLAAIQHYEQAIRLALHVDDDREIAHIYHGLSEAYRRSGDLMSAHLAGTQALEAYERLGDRKHEAVMHNRLGRILFRLSDYNAASDHYTESLSIASSDNNPRLIMVNCSALADLRLAQDRLEEAKRYNQRALEMSERVNNNYFCGLTYLVAGKVAQAEAQQAEGQQKQAFLDEAALWFSRASERLRETQAYTDLAEAYGKWAEVLEEQGHAQEAFTHWRAAYEVLSSARGTSVCVK